MSLSLREQIIFSRVLVIFKTLGPGTGRRGERLQDHHLLVLLLLYVVVVVDFFVDEVDVTDESVAELEDDSPLGRLTSVLL